MIDLPEIGMIEAKLNQLDGSQQMQQMQQQPAASSYASASQASDAASFESLVGGFSAQYAQPASLGAYGASGSAVAVAPPQIAALIDSTAAKYGVDPALVRAVVNQESGFDQFATSGAGAQGLMQLMPETAAGLGVTDSYDAAQNIEGGVKYLRQLLDTFGGDVRRAVAAYNAGPGAVEQYGGVPPYAETQNYVVSVLGGYAKYANAQV